MYDFGCGFGYGMYGFFWMAIFWILVFAVAGGLVVWLASRLKSPTASKSESAWSGPTALDILKERYARGEITKSEYEEMRADIEA